MTDENKENNGRNIVLTTSIDVSEIECRSSVEYMRKTPNPQFK